MTVSIGVVRSAGGAATYFASDNYYTAEQAETTSAWAGEGAKAAGLSGKVDAATFEKILDGKLPDGRQVGHSDKRDHGRDFTFSMPKSASLLAYVSGDKRILAAHMEAVKQTMAWAEKNLAEARLKVDGKDVPVRTGNLLYALFPHDTSRATDPQGHIHAVIANMTQLPKQFRQGDKVDPKIGEIIRDDGWRAWHNTTVYKASALLTSMANAHLREKIEALGYKTALEPKGKHGAFEILGPNGERITPAAIEGFSKRSADIKAKAEELGITSAEGRREITQRTRDAKIDPGDRETLTERWREEAREYGYNGDQIYQAALARSERGPTLLDRATGAITAAIEDISIRLGKFLSPRPNAAQRPIDPLIDRGLATLARSPAEVRTQYATASAVRILSERETAFATNDIIKKALDLGEQGVTAPLVELRINQLVEQGQLVQEKSDRLDKAVDVVTTKDAIVQEQRILAAMDAGMSAARPLLPADLAAQRLQELAGTRELNGQQLAAAIQIVSSHDRIVLVQGRAGAGKSTMLQPVAKAEAIDAAARLLGESGKTATLLTADIPGDTKGNAKALAFQNKMVEDLRQDTGLEAMTVHSFIASNVRFLEGTASPEALGERKAQLAGSYLILDEASMISNEQMDKLTAIANLMDVGRLAIIGDRKQLNPIDAGKAFALMLARSIRDGLGFSEVNINMRQKNDTMRAVADLADAGNVRAAIQVMGDRVVETQDRIGDAAHAWLALSPDKRETTTLLPSSREGRAKANEIIQGGLLKEGVLTGEGRNFNVRESVQVTHEEMRYAQNWQNAQFLRVGAKDNPIGLQTGDYRIKAVRDNGRVIVTDMQGRDHRIDPRKIDPMNRNDRLHLETEKIIKVHENENIRWTDTDKRAERGMVNARRATITQVTSDGIVVRLASGEERTLANGDPMLKRMDLAYAINTHMAQGITNEAVFSVMGSKERNLSNARAFLVNHTRQEHDVRLFTDDKEKLIAQLLENRGDKTSALEKTGEIEVEKLLRAGQATPSDSTAPQTPHRSPDRDRASADQPPLENAPASRQDAERIAASIPRETRPDLDLGRHAIPERSAPEKAPVRDREPQLDKSKGLEL